MIRREWIEAAASRRLSTFAVVIIGKDGGVSRNDGELIGPNYVDGSGREHVCFSH